MSICCLRQLDVPKGSDTDRGCCKTSVLQRPLHYNPLFLRHKLGTQIGSHNAADPVGNIHGGYAL